MNSSTILYKKPVWPVVALAVVLGSAAFSQEEPKRVTRAEALSALATKVQPQYPAMARQLKIQGIVEVDAYVSETGEVTKVKVVSGNAVLTGAATDAVKHWKFRPFADSDGRAIPVVAPIVLDFKM